MKLSYGDIIVTGYAQPMQDGSYSAKCIITDHTGPTTDEQILIGEEDFVTAEKAIAAALAIGRAWVDKKHPLKKQRRFIL